MLKTYWLNIYAFTTCKLNYLVYYDTLNKIAVVLTNFHVIRHPLCHEDYEFCVHVKVNMVEIANNMARKHKAMQTKYQMNCRARLQQRMFAGTNNTA